MQHDYFQKRNKNDFLTTPEEKSVCKTKIIASMLLYALFLFNLICNMTTFLKS